MILEHALLPVKPGREAEFVAAFDEAKQIISSMPGFVSLSLSRCQETRRAPSCSWWSGRRSRTTRSGFRGSAEYQDWRRLLHDFYDPFPVVEHFDPVISIPPDG